MSARKMLVVVIDKTKVVVGAAARRMAGVPAVADLVGPGLLLRMKGEDSWVQVPADELIVKEVDYRDDVVRQPLGHVLDATGSVVTPTLQVTQLNATSSEVTVKVFPVPQVEKTVLVLIDGGPGQPPVKLVGKTAAGVDTTKFAVSGLPSGEHLIIATVDAHAPLMAVGSFF